MGAKQLTSYTTRKPRYPHESGHHFILDYRLWKRENPCEKVVAETHFAGRDYWATASQVDVSNLYVIDPDGVQTLETAYNGPKKFRVIYIRTSAWTRYRRMRNRGDSRRTALKRLSHDRKAFRWAARYADVTINNDDFEVCCLKVEHYMLREDGI